MLVKTLRYFMGILSLICLSLPTVVNAATSTPPQVTVKTGILEGATLGQVENFFGIPYATAPKGELRWKTPQPAASWNGVRDAGQYGSACPQGAGLDSNLTTDEDCLFVNVQRPKGTTSNDKFPVLILIHGGGWQSGSGNNENLNALVETNGIVGVTMNYRLGNLGFLPHPAFADGKDVGNYGIQDQLAAIKWVQENIAQFGGDPDQVTIGGESSGGGSTCTLLASPESKGLFNKAIMMSTLCYAIPKEEALKQGEKIAESLGCTGSDAAKCLRSLPVEKLLDTEKNGVFNRVVKNTNFLPTSGWELIQQYKLSDMPMMIGGNRHEGRSFITNWAERSVPTYDKIAYEQYVYDHFGENAQGVLAVYPWPSESTRYTGTYLVADIMMPNFIPSKGGLSACKTSRYTELLSKQKSQTFAYEFAPDNGVGWFEVPGYDWGAGHATELPYLVPDRGNFANNGSALSEAHQQLSTEMLKYWGNFVKNGNPNGEGLLTWGAYKTNQGPVMELKEGGKSIAVSSVAIRSAHHCEFWESIQQEN